MVAFLDHSKIYIAGGKTVNLFKKDVLQQKFVIAVYSREHYLVHYYFDQQ